MSKVDTSAQKINDFLTRGVKDVIVAESVLSKLKSGSVLRVKHGVDPSSSELHLGHASVYLKLRDLQELGHKIVFLIGGFTGRFGDPTEKMKARKLRAKEETENAARDYMAQVGKILDTDQMEIHTNSEWYDPMPAEELLKLMSNFTVDQVLERDMFQTRQKKGEPIQLHEIVYPVLQGYDSVALKSDLTVIGRDQVFNENFGRELQKKYNQKPQDIVAIDILVGLDGQNKMGKSLNNYIGIAEDPASQFGKIMSLPDDLIISYFTLVTRVSLAEIKEMAAELAGGRVNPRDLKMKLASEIVGFFHSPEAARAAADNFTRTFSQKETPRDLETITIPSDKNTLLEIVIGSGLAKSKTEARRLIESGSVDIDGSTVKEPTKMIDIGANGLILKVGKHRFAKIVSR